jgi:C-terminal processing protease CtpA/Prc
VDVAFDSVSSVVDNSGTSKTDDSGRYRLEGAPTGPFTLRASKAGFRTRLVSGLRLASGGTLTQDMTLASLDGGGGLELSGIGASIILTHDGLVLAMVGAHDPAGRAGLEVGDHLLSIDGENAEGMSVADAVQRLRGETGTTVGVSVERPGTGQLLDVMIVRASIVR